MEGSLARPQFFLQRLVLLAVGFFLVWSCSSAPKAPETRTQTPEPAKPTVVIKRVPEAVSDLQIEMAARDLMSLAGLDTRAFQIHAKNGSLEITGTAESSRALNNALALMQRLKGVKQVRANIDGETVSGTTQPPPEETGLFIWFVRLFWPILALIGAAFLAIGFLFFQTRYIAKQIRAKREISELSQ